MKRARMQAEFHENKELNHLVFHENKELNHPDFHENKGLKHLVFHENKGLTGTDRANREKLRIFGLSVLSY